MAAALAPPAVPTIVPEPGDSTVAGGPDPTQVLDLGDLAAAAAGAAPLAATVTPAATTGGAGIASTAPPTTTPGPAAVAHPGAPEAPEAPAAAPVPLAGRRRPPFRLRVGLAALGVIALVILLAQVLKTDSADDLVADVARSAATTPSTAAPTTTVPSPGAALAAQLRGTAGRLNGADGAASADLAGRMRTVADMLERGDLQTAATATGLIVDVARWFQDGQLTAGATVTAVQLLQQVPGVNIAGSAPAAASGPPTTAASAEVFVPDNNALKNPPGKDDKQDKPAKH
jgi:hypothetical protein